VNRLYKVSRDGANIKEMRRPDQDRIFGDERQIRSYMYIDDAVEATVVAWKTEASYGMYNKASENWITVYT
jgi:UDP-glucose 4-epimerase